MTIAATRPGWYDPRWLAAHALGTAPLLSVAFLNGAPLLFADSGSYLRIGTELYYPTDRPVVYGLAILPFHAPFGLWGPIAAQGVLATVVIRMVLLRAIGTDRPVALVGCCLLLATCSSLPWFVGQLMPDVLTGFVPLVVYLIFAADARWQRWPWAAVLAGLCACHLSHLPLALVTLAAAALCRIAYGGWRAAVAPTAAGLGAVVTAILVLSVLNLVAVDRFTPSPSSDRFMVARLFDGRIAQPVLADLCLTRRLRLCGALPFVRDPSRALPGQDYLWSAASPASMLAAGDPEGYVAEEALLVHETLARRPAAAVRLAASGWWAQLVHARIGDGLVPYGPGMQVRMQVATHFPRSAPAVAASLQQRGALQRIAAVASWIDIAAAVLAVAISAYLLASGRLRGSCSLPFAVPVVVAFVGNAAVTGILSGPFDRYQSRVLWLLPLLGFVAIAQAVRRGSVRAG